MSCDEFADATGSACGELDIIATLIPFGATVLIWQAELVVMGKLAADPSAPAGI